MNDCMFRKLAAALFENKGNCRLTGMPEYLLPFVPRIVPRRPLDGIACAGEIRFGLGPCDTITRLASASSDGFEVASRSANLVLNLIMATR